MEGPMTLCVAKIDLVNEETHWERSAFTEVVILVANMNMLDIQLDSIEYRGQEAQANRLIEVCLNLLFTLVVLLW